jgi:hypothetical protein
MRPFGDNGQFEPIAARFPIAKVAAHTYGSPHPTRAGPLAYEVRRHGVRIATVEGSLDSGTAVGQLVFNMLASVATMERELISARTRR